MTLAPSGGSGDSQACSVAITVRAGRNASAPPPQPWPRITETVGTVIVVSVAMQRAISPAMRALLGVRRELGARGVDDA